MLELKEEDVVFTWGAGLMTTQGNRRYWEMILSLREQYKTLSPGDHYGKFHIERQILDAVAKSGGRFLRCDSHHQQEVFRELPQTAAINKIRSALRDTYVPEFSSSSSTVGTRPPSTVKQDITEALELRDEDVFVGEGCDPNNHPGNVSYLTEVRKHQQEYQALKRKSNFAKDIFNWVVRRNGRFLRRDSDGEYQELSVNEALIKINDALRNKTYRVSREDEVELVKPEPPPPKAVSLSPPINRDQLKAGKVVQHSEKFKAVERTEQGNIVAPYGGDVTMQDVEVSNVRKRPIQPDEMPLSPSPSVERATKRPSDGNMKLVTNDGSSIPQVITVSQYDTSSGHQEKSSKGPDKKHSEEASIYGSSHSSRASIENDADGIRSISLRSSGGMARENCARQTVLVPSENVDANGNSDLLSKIPQDFQAKHSQEWITDPAVRSLTYDCAALSSQALLNPTEPPSNRTMYFYQQTDPSRSTPVRQNELSAEDVLFDGESNSTFSSQE